MLGMVACKAGRIVGVGEERVQARGRRYKQKQKPFPARKGQLLKIST